MFYYCSNSTFLSIITGKSIWLSDMTKSNDYAEIRGYFDLLDSVLVETLGDGIYAENGTVSLAERTRRTIEEKLKFYICLAMCFSSDGDSLSQWRAYGDDGHGISIGFEESILLMFTDKRNAHPLINLNPVRYYDEKGLRGILKREIEALKTNYRRGKTSDDRQAIISDWVSKIIQLEAPYYKKKEFESEKETRLCYSRFIMPGQLNNIDEDSKLNSLFFRTRREDIIPYLSLDISCYPKIINSIIIGPCNHTEERDIHNLLERYNYDVPMIRKSVIPYRSK